VRAVSVDRDALIVTSRIWQTTATAVRAGGETLLIDSPYFPDEHELLPGVLGQAGLEPDALLATHADFDHMLGRLAFPELALGVGESTAERLRLSPGAVQR
jgi:glyoxylase-like metal-dependent hydrolase (beta-lactamase superfamily II)